MQYWEKSFPQVFKRAKREAENDGSAVSVLNLNRVGAAMLVIRPREFSNDPSCVAQVHMDGTVTELLDSGNRPIKK